MVDEFKVRMSDPLIDVLFAASEEVVDDRDFVALKHEIVHQM